MIKLAKYCAPALGFMLLAGLLFCIFPQQASSTPVTIVITDPITNGGDLDEMLERVLSWLWPLALIVGVLMILIAAYYFIFSAGDPNKVAAGRKIFVYSLVGIAIVTTATGIVAFVREVADPAVEPPEILIQIIYYVFGGVLVASVIMILISAYLFMTSAGSPERAGKAKKTLVYALAGLLIAVTVRGIINFLAHILGSDTGGIL